MHAFLTTHKGESLLSHRMSTHLCVCMRVLSAVLSNIKRTGICGCVQEGVV